MTPERFAVEMKALADGIEVNVDRAVRQTALKVLVDVTLATPVDTGRARANWIASVGAPAQAGVPWPDNKSSAGSAANTAISRGNAAISTGASGQSIHITNNLPYIGRLNDGHSKQAPKSFVELAIISALAALKKAKII